MNAACKLAFVGPADAVSPWLLRAMSQAGAQFVAICDDDAARAARSAAEFHVRWPFHGIRTLLAETSPDGVVVAAPPNKRTEIVRRCMAAGASVLLPGPPPEIRGSGFRKSFCWSAGAGRFSPAGALAQRLISSGKLGEIVSVQMSLVRWRAAKSVADTGWPVSPDTMFEALDWLVSLVGPVQEVFARGHPDGAVSATLVTRADVPICLSLCEHGPPERSGCEIEIRGADGGTLTIDRDMRLTCLNGARVTASYAPSLGASDPATEFGYVGLIREFVHRIAERGRGGDDAASVGSIVEAMTKSLTRKAAVSLQTATRGRATKRT